MLQEEPGHLRAVLVFRWFGEGIGEVVESLVENGGKRLYVFGMRLWVIRGPLFFCGLFNGEGGS